MSTGVVYTVLPSGMGVAAATFRQDRSQSQCAHAKKGRTRTRHRTTDTPRQEHTHTHSARSRVTVQHRHLERTVAYPLVVAAVSQKRSVWTAGGVLLLLVPRCATVYALLRCDGGYPTGCLSSSGNSLQHCVVFPQSFARRCPTTNLTTQLPRSSLGLLLLGQALAGMKLHGEDTTKNVQEAHEAATCGVSLDTGIFNVWY